MSIVNAHLEDMISNRYMPRQVANSPVNIIIMNREWLYCTEYDQRQLRLLASGSVDSASYT